MLWYLENQLKETCSKADKMKFEEESQIDNYLKTLENQIQLQQTSEHLEELKFIEINRRSELPIFAKLADFEGQEFLWNSYTAQDNLGPAVEFNHKINLESSIVDQEDMHSSQNYNADIWSGFTSNPSVLISKRGVNSSSNAELVHQKNNKQMQLDRLIVFNDAVEKTADRQELELEKEPEEEIMSISTKNQILTATIFENNQTPTTTETLIKYIKTMTTTLTETYDVYDLTTTVQNSVQVTKTIRDRAIQTVFVTETPLVIDMLNQNSTTTSSSRPGSTLTISVITSTESKPLEALSSTVTRKRISNEIPSPRVSSTRRTRNGYFHQKLLAQKNLKMQYL